MFSFGLGVRLLGLALLWMGDGSSLWWRKAMVIAGVVLSIGGITAVHAPRQAALASFGPARVAVAEGLTGTYRDCAHDDAHLLRSSAACEQH